MFLTIVIGAFVGYGLGYLFGRVCTWFKERTMHKQLKENEKALQQYNADLQKLAEKHERWDHEWKLVEIMVDRDASEEDKVAARNEWCDITGVPREQMPITLEEGETFFG